MQHQFTQDFTLSTATVLREKGAQLIRESQDVDIVFDFSEVNRCDAAGVALLLSWLREAKTGDKKLTFTHLPKPLLQIATLCGVDVLLSGDAHG